MKPIGAILRDLRTMHGMQQVDVIVALAELGIEANKQKISRWENGRNKPTVEQFLALCRLYKIRDVAKVFIDQDYSDLKQELNTEGQQKLNEYKNILIASGLFSPVKHEPKVIPFTGRSLPIFSIGASAGTGQFLDSDDYEMYDVPYDVPISATFGLHVCGDSMEPTLYDGDLLWVHQQPTLENGEIGIFYLDGNAYVKEYRYTDEGTFLISHNKKYPPIKVTEDNESKIYGKVVHPV